MVNIKYIRGQTMVKKTDILLARKIYQDISYDI